MAALHRARIKRWKRRKKTNKKRFWTTRPTKHGQTPPPRKRRFHPPVKQARQNREDREDTQSEQSRSHKTPASTRYTLAPPGTRAPPPPREPPDTRPQQTHPGRTPLRSLALWQLNSRYFRTAEENECGDMTQVFGGVNTWDRVPVFRLLTLTCTHDAAERGSAVPPRRGRPRCCPRSAARSRLFSPAARASCGG